VPVYIEMETYLTKLNCYLGVLGHSADVDVFDNCCVFAIGLNKPSGLLLLCQLFDHGKEVVDCLFRRLDMDDQAGSSQEKRFG